MFAKELSVQVDELSEETSVRDNTPVFFHSTNSLHKSQVLLQHQVSQDQGGGAAHSYMAMHQHFAWKSGRDCIRDMKHWYCKMVLRAYKAFAFNFWKV